MEGHPQHEPLKFPPLSSPFLPPPAPDDPSPSPLPSRHGAKLCKRCAYMTFVCIELQATVDKEVSQLLTKQEAEEQLASLQQRREALQVERDGKQQQRSQLELQLMRFDAQKPHGSALAESWSASSHQAAAQQSDRNSHQGQGSSGSSPDDGLESLELHQREHQADQPHESASLSPEQVSCEEEETKRQAAALDDAVDTCQAQMQYLDSRVAECKTVSTIQHTGYILTGKGSALHTLHNVCKVCNS